MVKMGGQGEERQRKGTQEVSEVRKLKCCFDVKEFEIKGSHGPGLGTPLVGGLW